MPNAWKDHERQIAARLGGKRAGPTGRTGSDVLHDWLAIECKERKSLPAWMKAAMKQSVDAATDGLLPIVVWHVLGQRHDQDVVMMRLKDFEEWFGGQSSE